MSASEEPKTTAIETAMAAMADQVQALATGPASPKVVAFMIWATDEKGSVAVEVRTPMEAQDLKRLLQHALDLL